MECLLWNWGLSCPNKHIKPLLTDAWHTWTGLIMTLLLKDYLIFQWWQVPSIHTLVYSKNRFFFCTCAVASTVLVTGNIVVNKKKKPCLHGTLIWRNIAYHIYVFICLQHQVVISAGEKWSKVTGQRVARSSEATVLSFPKLDLISSWRHFIFPLGIMTWTTESSRYKNHDFCWIDLYCFFL